IQGLLTLLQSQGDSTEFWLKRAIVNGMLNFRRSTDTTAIALSEMPALFKKPETIPLELQPLLQKLTSVFTWPGKPQLQKRDSLDEQDIDPALFASGRQQYNNLCASCHGTQGEGMARFAPPLRQSEWVTGKDYKLAMILLHGMEGPVPVNGKTYDHPDILPNMPSFSTLQNEDIAAIATYIRNSWGHTQPPISSGTVGRIRYLTQGKVTPWTANELDTLRFDTDL
ncbi:MAG: cytochrome c, partial [Pricia sp.]|nr:cytochrome c [Pricia sp.]